MSESAINGPAYEPSGESSSDAQLVSFNSRLPENSPDNNAFETADASLELRSLLDTSMSQAQIDAIVDTWNPRKLYYGKQNYERPHEVIQWMLEQTNITVDVREEKAQRDALAERERRRARGLPTLKAHKNLSDLTPEQTRKLELAHANDAKMTAAQRKVEAFAAKGLSGLLEMIEEVEDQVMEKCANANVVRLFNGVDDRTGGMDRDLIVAKRTLVVILSNELPSESNQ